MTAIGLAATLPRMALGSILLSLAAAAFTLLGMFAVILPFAGSFLSFGAPALAVLGVILGGVAMSRARQEGEGNGAALAGVIMNSLVFIPALLGALTCGVCNAVLSGASVAGPGPQVRFHVGDPGTDDADAGPAARHPLAPPPLASPDAGAPAVEAATGALPPPPLAPGPAGGP